MHDLTDMLLSRGAVRVGFADLTALRPEARDGMPRGVSMAVALTPSIVAGIADGPTPEYCDEYDRANRLLDALTAAAAEFLRAEGHRAAPAPATRPGITRDTLSTPLPHKTVATRAGLGWIGKCALLVTEQYGPAVRLGSVITDAPLAPAEPVTESRCGECSECVKVCPGRAASGRLWRAGMAREEFFDARACYDALQHMPARRGVRRAICGMCIAACPWTKTYLTGRKA